MDQPSKAPTAPPAARSPLAGVLVGLGLTLVTASLLAGVLPLGASPSGWSCGSAFAPSERATNLFLDPGTAADCAGRRTAGRFASGLLLVVGAGLVLTSRAARR